MLQSSTICFRPLRRFALLLGMIALVWSATPFGDVRALDLEAQRKLVNKGVLGMLGDGARGTDFAMIADLAVILDEGYDRRILPMAGSGSVRAIEDLLLLRGVDVVFVQADVLDFYKKAELFPDIDTKIRYITKLYSKEFHLLASKDIGSIEDLAGRRVNFGPPSSGTFLTASLVFEALGIEVDARDDDYQIALDKLRQGEIDAWVRVDAKPSLQLEKLPAEEDVHLLPIPESVVGEPYAVTEFAASDYSNLIEQDATVGTLAVPTVMAVYAWPSRHQKRRLLQRFGEALSEGLLRLQGGPFHDKWREVDLGAEIAGWQRF